MIATKLKYTISSNLTIKDTICELNKLSGDVLTLFILDNDDRLVGTVTDGDIRRNIVLDVNLSDNVTIIMNRNFSNT